MKRLLTKLQTIQTNCRKSPTDLQSTLKEAIECQRTLSTCNNIGQYHLHSNAAALDREIIFENILNNQQLRHYAPTFSNPDRTVIECWNCKKSPDSILEALICKSCGCLQDLNTDINYFNLMNLQQTFEMPIEKLSKRFHYLQSLVHPDKYINKSTREQSNSTDWSTFINKAYRTLLKPIDRGEYLLKLFAQRLPENDTQIDKQFLMQMLQRNEEVEEANNIDDLKQLTTSLTKELEDHLLHLNKAFNNNDLLTFKMLLMKMRYLLSLEQSLKTKLQSFNFADIKF